MRDAGPPRNRGDNGRVRWIVILSIAAIVALLGYEIGRHTTTARGHHEDATRRTVQHQSAKAERRGRARMQHHSRPIGRATGNLEVQIRHRRMPAHGFAAPAQPTLHGPCEREELRGGQVERRAFASDPLDLANLERGHVGC